MSIKKVKGTRLLITVNVLGSAGPLRFVVNENDKVAKVVDTALKQYGREGRLPLLSSNVNDFLLYSASAGMDALGPSELIGSLGVRNFILCKKQKQAWMTEGRAHGNARSLSPLASRSFIPIESFSCVFVNWGLVNSIIILFCSPEWPYNARSKFN
ncbi:hypothetical protein AABB24_024947 [Solanum stoloniferum]|uniref:DUF7054 domain-containing protein n=1 Tax=Solanum stoloniferum TaxID=62892 RepID=A0ABD2SR25_9SOLN